MLVSALGAELFNYAAQYPLITSGGLMLMAWFLSKEKNMTRTTTLTIAAPEMLFSAGHFTIFSATEREPLHGHNFTVTAEITAAVDSNGMTCDYRVYKKKYIALCKQLKQYLFARRK